VKLELGTFRCTVCADDPDGWRAWATKHGRPFIEESDVATWVEPIRDTTAHCIRCGGVAVLVENLHITPPRHR
jgi:hypothetical protein